MKKEYKTLGKGKQKEYNSGMNREISNNKPRFDLLIPKDQPYNETLLYRWAMLMERGAQKYSERNWEKANSLEELARFKQSITRHFFQWFSGEEDEDHASAILFNLNAYEWLKEKL